MSFSTLPPDSRTLVSKWNTKLASIWKEDFGPLGNSPVLLLLSPGKMPLTTTVAKFLDTSVCGGSWCLDPSLSPFLVKFTQILELILLDNPHKAAVLSVGCASLSSTLFPYTQLSVNMLGYSTPWTASFFGNECLWLTFLVKGVTDSVSSRSRADSVGSPEQSRLWSGYWSGLSGLPEQSGLWSGLYGLPDWSGLWTTLSSHLAVWFCHVAWREMRWGLKCRRICFFL